MKIVEQSWSWVAKPVDPLTLIETAGRTCYKSEAKINADSARGFAGVLLMNGHESVLEHASATVRLVTNRGLTHELVRHRLASYSQESTRYCRYNGDLEFIKPVWWDDWSAEEQRSWERAMQFSETEYLFLLAHGSRPEQAREILPNSLKTEIVVTANMREWRHIFKLRCSPRSHPQMRALAKSLLTGFYDAVPIIFDNLHSTHNSE